MFGWAFAVPYAALMAVGAHAVVRLAQTPGLAVRPRTGVAGRSGVATVALTFTLLGISLGIGGLSGTALTPDNVQGVIAELTGHFSVAFMTTVVGLPSAALLRAVVTLTATRRVPGISLITYRSNDA